MAKSIARFLADVASTTGVLDGTLSTAAQPNITSVGTLSSLTISGNLNATLTTAAQTNITSLGTLSSLNLSGALTGTTGTFTTADNLTQVRLISTDADASIGPRLDLFRNSASPAAGDFIGRVRFLAEDSTGAETAYVHFDTLIDDPTDGSEDGQLRIETKVDGSMVERITMDSTETVINDNHANLDFRIESDTKANAFFIEGTTGIVGINTNTPTSTLDVNGSSGIYSRHSTGGALVLDDVDTADGSTPMVYMRNTAGQLKLGRANRSSGLTTGSTDSMTISATGDAHFTGNVEVGNNTDITMDGSASGQLQVDGNGYSGAIALDGTAMYVYHNSNGRALVLGTNETTAVSINGANQDVSFSSHIDLPDSKYLRLGNAADFILYHDGTTNYVQAVKQDSDIIFRGNDGGTGTNMLTLDTSAGGIAKFNAGLRPVTDGVGTLGSSSLRWEQLHVKSVATEGIKFTIEDTTAASAMIGVRVDMDISGSDATGGDRANYGQYITLNSTATGGDTADEHRLYGLRSLAKATGDSDLIYGGFFTGEAEHSSGTVSAVYGSYSQAAADPDSGGTVNNVYAAYNYATLYGSAGSTVTSAYASHNKLLLGAADEVAHSSLHGVYSEIETDASTSGTGRTTNQGFLFRGVYDDDSSAEHKFTNFYGIHLSGSNLSTRVDGTGTVAGVYLDMPGVDAGFWNSEDQLNYFRGSLAIGSGSKNVANTVGMELHLVEPQGGDMIFARNDSATTTNEVLGRIYFGATEDSGTTVNYNASIEAYAGGPQSTSDSEGYLVFKTTPNNSTTLTESFRIRSDGNISLPSQVATGSLPQARLEVVAAASGNCINTQVATAGSYACFGGSGPTTSGGNSYQFGRMINSSGSQVGTIVVSHSGTAYNQTSDYRLKENVTELTNATTRLKQLQPKRFNFIEVPDKTVDGFLAHEVSNIVPEAITGEKDAVDADGNPDYQGIDQSKLVPLLVAAVQEQQTLIETLQAEVAALKGS